MQLFMNRSEFDDKWEQYILGDEYDAEDIAKGKKVYALVIYDIVDNKRRTRFAKVMEGYGKRVQKSGFEVRIPEKKFQELLKLIPKYCTSEDSIRVYRITGDNLVYKWGADIGYLSEDVVIF